MPILGYFAICHGAVTMISSHTGLVASWTIAAVPAVVGEKAAASAQRPATLLATITGPMGEGEKRGHDANHCYAVT